MSVQATTWVWEHARDVSGTALLVLLAVADAANREGEQSCQSVATLASMARTSERTVQRALRELEAGGWLKPMGTDPRYRTTVYAIPGVTTGAGGVIQGTLGVTSGADEGDTAMSPDPRTTTPRDNPKGAAPSRGGPADQVAADVYEGTDKAVRYVVVRAIATWALKHRPDAGAEAITAAMIGLHNAGKPITQQLVAQVLDGIIRLDRAAARRRDRTAGQHSPEGWQFMEAQ